jgi:hypothetical protein
VRVEVGEGDEADFDEESRQVEQIGGENIGRVPQIAVVEEELEAQKLRSNLVAGWRKGFGNFDPLLIKIRR